MVNRKDREEGKGLNRKGREGGKGLNRKARKGGKGIIWISMLELLPGGWNSDTDFLHNLCLLCGLCDSTLCPLRGLCD